MMRSLAILALLLAACGDDSTPDAGVDAGVPDAAAQPDADLGMAACQVAQQSPDGVGTPLAPAAAAPVCKVICDYLAGCGVNFPTCATSCVAQSQTRRADAVCTVAGCLRCPVSDKDSPCRRLVMPRPAHADFQTQCQMKLQSCGATASQISATCDATSLTTPLKLLTDAAMADAVACLARPCGEQADCIAGVLGPEPRPF